MRPDFYIHIITSLFIFYLFRNIGWLLFIQIGKEIFDYIDYAGFDLLDWWADFSAILIIIINIKIAGNNVTINADRIVNSDNVILIETDSISDVNLKMNINEFKTVKP